MFIKEKAKLGQLECEDIGFFLLNGKFSATSIRY
jgi:hypothetical protein